MTAGGERVQSFALRTWGVGSSFTYMEDLFRLWLEGAQPSEIQRLLELVQEELARRGQAFNYTVEAGRHGRGKS